MTTKWKIRQPDDFDRRTFYAASEGVDLDKMNELISRVFAFDRALGGELEEEVNCVISEIGVNGFIAGWQACRNPERIIFDTGEGC